jgi:hypothetical protein
MIKIKTAKNRQAAGPAGFLLVNGKKVIAGRPSQACRF